VARRAASVYVQRLVSGIVALYREGENVSCSAETEEAEMRDIAKLLFGDDAGQLLDLLAGNDRDVTASDGDGFGLAERVRRSGEWCGTMPGRGQAAATGRTASRGR
jgi:hypothetical protein